jgi:hypothetical protein
MPGEDRGAISMPCSTPHAAICIGIQPSKFMHQVHPAEASSGKAEPPKTIAESAASMPQRPC